MSVVEEYQALKSEQIDRIKQRDTFLNLNIVAIFAATAIAVPGGDRNAALLLLPWTTSILGWTYLSNDDKVSAIAGQLRHLAGAGRGMAWEKGNKGVLPRKVRRVGDFIVFTLAFIVPSVLAIAVYLGSRLSGEGKTSAWLVVACAMEGLLTVGLWAAYAASALVRARS